ncbi:MAG: hypothetical protein SVX43_19770 [Cyanobacteriota bacterium]|nr:hypothetical protein [Cyanobacteriota bacterium]
MARPSQIDPSSLAGAIARSTSGQLCPQNENRRAEFKMFRTV